MLEPVFGAGAFAAGGHRLEQWLDAQSPEAMSFFLAWMRCQAGVRDTDVRGPLDDELRQAGVASEGRCSTRSPCSASRQVEFQRLSTLAYSRVSQPDTQRGARGGRWTSSRRR